MTKTDIEKESASQFRGGVRVTFGPKCSFELVCGLPGRRKFSKGKLNAPIAIDNWMAGRMRTLLERCEVNDGLQTLTVELPGMTLKSYMLFIESDFQHGVLVDKRPVKEIMRITLPACIYKGLEKIVELCPGGMQNKQMINKEI